FRDLEVGGAEGIVPHIGFKFLSQRLALPSR
ncbi:MAG: hypothetical protein ACI92C_002629, partial [Neolewinella sp.]